MSAPSAVRTVTTPRLVMRGFADADREPFAAMNADPRVMEHFPTPLTRAESDAFVDRVAAHWAARGWGLWALERRDTGAFCGFAGLWPVRFRAPFTTRVEVGWRLGTEHWGQGFATEAGGAALGYGFTVLGLPEVVSFTSVTNVRSQAVMRRLGMQREPAWDFEHPSVPEGSPLRPHVVHRARAHGRAGRA